MRMLVILAGLILSGCRFGPCTNDDSEVARYRALVPQISMAIPSQPPPKRLVGTWRSSVVMTEVGPVQNTVTFSPNWTVFIITRSTLPLVGVVQNTSGPFRIEGDRIMSNSIRGGLHVRYWFEDEQLMVELEDGEVVRFRQL